VVGSPTLLAANGAPTCARDVLRFTLPQHFQITDNGYHFVWHDAQNSQLRIFREGLMGQIKAEGS